MSCCAAAAARPRAAIAAPPTAISSTPTNAGNSPAFASRRIFDMGVVRNLRQVSADDVGVDIAFRADVHAGLAQRRKAIPARWFYDRSEEHTSELQSLMRISYAVFCLTKK